MCPKAWNQRPERRRKMPTPVFTPVSATLPARRTASVSGSAGRRGGWAGTRGAAVRGLVELRAVVPALRDVVPRAVVLRALLVPAL